MYFADTGGFVWRLDLSEKLTVSGDTESKLYKFARLGDDNTRKFYNEPDVAVLKIGGETKFVVSIGSGFRAHPLEKVIDDKFFILRDDSPFDPPVRTDDAGNTTPRAPIIVGDKLAEIDLGAPVADPPSIKDYRGLMLDLPNDGEKVLATSITVDGNVIVCTQ